MGWPNAIDHLFNFVLPALAMALLVPTLARLLWWRAWQGVPWWSVVRRVAAAGVVVLLAGLAALGRDGSIYTYAALVVSSATVVWWMVFKGRS